MQTTPKNLLKLGRLTPAQLFTLAQTIAVRMNANVLYPSPVNPTLLDLATLITALGQAIVNRGTKRNKGTASGTVLLSSAVADMRAGLYGLATYVTNTTPYDKDALITTGFVIAGKKHKSKRLQAVRNATAVASRSTNLDETKLSWKKGLGGVKANDNKIFRVYWNNAPDFTTAVMLMQTTRTKVVISSTSLTQKPVANGGQIYFWVVGQNGKGQSVTSNMMVSRFVDLGA